MFAALLCTVLFSISVISGHRSARHMGGTEANFWRVTVAAVVLGPWCFATGTGLDGAGFSLFVLSGLFGIGVGDIVFFQALPRLGSRLTSLLMQCFSAPFGALVEYLWIGTTLHVGQVAAGLVVLLGVAIALSPGSGAKIGRKALVIGVSACLLAALANAMGAVLSRKAYAVTHAAGESIDAGSAGFQRVLGGTILAGICLLLVKRQEWRVQSRAPGHLVVAVSRKKWQGIWPWVLVNGLAGQTLGVTCMQLALETTPAGLVLAVIAATPIVVIPFTYFFEGERPTIHSVIGGVIAVAGVIGIALF